MLEVITRLEGEPLAYHTLSGGQALVVGPRAGCDLVVSEALAERPIELLRYEAIGPDDEPGGCTVRLPPGATMSTVDDAGRVETLLAGEHRLVLPGHGAAEIALSQRLTLQLRETEAPERVAASGGFGWREQRSTALSAVAHLTLMIMIAAIPPDGFALTSDHFDRAARFVPTLNQPLDRRVPRWLQQGPPGGGKAAAGERGALGDPKTRPPKQPRRYGVRGRDDRSQPSGKIEVATAGVLGILASSRAVALLVDPGQRAIGADAEQALGRLQGDLIGQDYGTFGLALDGTGRGGGCVGVDCGAVGLGDTDVGRIGNLRAPGSSYGWSDNKARALGRRPRVPQIHTGRATLRGALSREIIRRVVRQHINQVRFCYQQGLQSERSLRGRIVVQFLITGNGTVGVSRVAESTLGSPSVEQCVAQAVRRWAFPAPEGGGLVTVTYPFTFHHAEAS